MKDGEETGFNKQVIMNLAIEVLKAKPDLLASNNSGEMAAEELIAFIEALGTYMVAD